MIQDIAQQSSARAFAIKIALSVLLASAGAAAAFADQARAHHTAKQQAGQAGSDFEAEEPGDLHVELSTAGEKLEFNRKRIVAYPGQILVLKFTNNAPAGSGLVHDWVLVKPGKIPEVGRLGTDAGIDPGAIEVERAVLAATRRLEPGESATLSFEVPQEPGEYPYICSVQNHWQTMRGTLVVRKVK